MFNGLNTKSQKKSSFIHKTSAITCRLFLQRAKSACKKTPIKHKNQSLKKTGTADATFILTLLTTHGLLSMKMNKLALSIFAASTIAASSFANATDMYIDLGTNNYDETDATVTSTGTTFTAGGIPYDANTQTGIFTEFGFGQLLATSVYDFSSGSIGIGTTFYDTNNSSNFTTLGIPTSGTALDGSSTVSLALPTAGQLDIDNLSPLTSDDEGFQETWVLTTEYFFNGVITASGPQYTSGTFTVNFIDLIDSANNFVAFAGDIVGSSFVGANLEITFEIDQAADNFLFTTDSNGNFVDVEDLVSNNGKPTITLDTNVNPPTPTPNQLLQIGTNAVRQTTLDGSFVVNVPEPSSIAIFGAGLLALAGLRKKAKK